MVWACQIMNLFWDFCRCHPVRTNFLRPPTSAGLDASIPIVLDPFCGVARKGDNLPLFFDIAANRPS
jgi:hypothetical protein